MIQSKINVNAKKFINIDETWWRLLCQTPCLDQEIDSLKWPSDAGSSYKTHIYDVGMCFHLPYPYTSPNRVTMTALVMMNFLIVYRSWCCRYQVRPLTNFAIYQWLHLIDLGKELVSFVDVMLLDPDLIVRTHVCLFFYNATNTTCYVATQVPTHRNIYLMTSYDMYREPVRDLSSSIPFCWCCYLPKVMIHSLRNDTMD